MGFQCFPAYKYRVINLLELYIFFFLVFAFMESLHSGINMG